MDLADQIRRVVTGHDTSGKAVVLFDSANPHKVIRPATGVVNRALWVTETSPARMDTPADRAAGNTAVAPPPGGSVFRIVDFPSMTDAEIATFDPHYLANQIPHEDSSPKYRPSSHPFMHRTRTVDYAIVLNGEIEMKLDDDETIRFRAGDVLVQQGTNHAWINRSGKPCRIAFILLDAQDPL